jgi:hypothetical protein
LPPTPNCYQTLKAVTPTLTRQNNSFSVMPSAMSKVPPAKKWTPEVLRGDPLLGRLARIRLKQLKTPKPTPFSCPRDFTRAKQF